MLFMMLQLCQPNSSEGGHGLWKCLQIAYHRSLGLTMSIRFPTPRPRGPTSGVVATSAKV